MWGDSISTLRLLRIPAASLCLLISCTAKLQTPPILITEVAGSGASAYTGTLFSTSPSFAVVDATTQIPISSLSDPIAVVDATTQIPISSLSDPITLTPFLDPECT